MKIAQKLNKCFTNETVYAIIINGNLPRCSGCGFTIPWLGDEGILKIGGGSTMLKEIKQNVIENNRLHETDTGSPEVQIAILSRRIDELALHLKKNAKDNHSRRGLLSMVADRKAHKKYLEKKNPRRYNALVKKLGLKK